MQLILYLALRISSFVQKLKERYWNAKRIYKRLKYNRKRNPVKSGIF